MILSNNQIKETIDKGNIQITPFEYSQIEPASYDLRIENRGQLLYPFYFENPDTYFKKLEETINVVIESDLPFVFGVDAKNTIKLKKTCETYLPIRHEYPI